MNCMPEQCHEGLCNQKKHYGTYTVKAPNGDSYLFDGEGRLSLLTDNTGKTVSIRYSQNDIRGTFENGASVNELVYHLKKSPQYASNIEPIRIVKYNDLPSEVQKYLSKQGVSSSCCDECFRDYRWYKYCLNIKGVKEYQAINIEDYYKKKINTPSSFSEVLDILSDKTDLRTIIIETYDWAYIVVCEDFEFAITGRR